MTFFHWNVYIIGQNIERVYSYLIGTTSPSRSIAKVPHIIQVKHHANSAFVQVVIYSGLFFLLPSPFIRSISFYALVKCTHNKSLKYIFGQHANSFSSKVYQVSYHLIVKLRCMCLPVFLFYSLMKHY